MDKELQAFESAIEELENICNSHVGRDDPASIVRDYCNSLNSEIAHLKAQLERLRNGIIDYRHNGGTVLANAAVNRKSLSAETWESILDAWRQADKELYALTKPEEDK